MKYGTLFGATISAYYFKEEITNVSIGAVRLARAGTTVTSFILFSLPFSFIEFSFFSTFLQVGRIILDYHQVLNSQKLDQLTEGYKIDLSEVCQEYTKVSNETVTKSSLIQVHLRSAQRLLKLCEANGGAFIKVGQHLGALDYLIPNEYVRTMRVLHSKAPQSTYEEILSVIRQDLKREVINLLFSY